MKKNRTENWGSVTHSLSMLALLAYMYKRNFVPKDAVLELWSDALTRMDKPIREYISYRKQTEGLDQWPYLLELLDANTARLNQQNP